MEKGHEVMLLVIEKNIGKDEMLGAASVTVFDLDGD